MVTREPSIERQALLLRAYLAYNAQDVERLLALVGDDVNWPDDGGGRIHGRHALSAYWTEQWKRVRTHDHPIAFKELDDGRVAVHIRQVVRSLDGSTTSTGEFTHLHRIESTHIARMDIEKQRLTTLRCL
jgi:ketosteroid isomerase-like protein